MRFKKDKIYDKIFTRASQEKPTAYYCRSNDGQKTTSVVRDMSRKDRYLTQVICSNSWSGFVFEVGMWRCGCYQ